MTIRPRMLDHPFYQAWTRGELTREELAVYHRSYADLIQNVPSFWQIVVNAFQPDLPQGSTIVQEERDHILLWEHWGRSLPTPEDYPKMEKEIRTFTAMSPSRLLGALQALEMQQPEVSETKKAALLDHYGFSPAELVYFDEHLLEERHIAYGAWIAENFADRKEYEEGLAGGAKMLYDSLDKFVNI